MTGIVAVLTGRCRPRPDCRHTRRHGCIAGEEPAGLPFVSRARATWNNEDVPVMHACGHDCHTAILMAVAEILGRARNQAARDGEAAVPAGRGKPAAGRDRRRTAR